MSTFKIKQIFDHSTALNLMVIASVKKLLLSQFPYMKPQYLEDLIDRVTTNKSEIYKHYLFVAEKNGAVIGCLKKPTLVVQEGGYKTQLLGINARNFFLGLKKGYYQA